MAVLRLQLWLLSVYIGALQRNFGGDLAPYGHSSIAAYLNPLTLYTNAHRIDVYRVVIFTHNRK
jgi:hypothetical protein